MSQLFNITHDAGNLNEYTATVTDSGDLSVAVAAALVGTPYGLSCLIDDTTVIYGHKHQAAPASNQIRWRFYIDPNTLSITSDRKLLVCRLEVAGDPWDLNLVYLSWNGATYSLINYCYGDAGAIAGDGVNITDAPHYVEIHIQRAATNVSADGHVHVWVDGASIVNRTNIDNYDAFAIISNFNFGAEDIGADTAGAFYIDEIVCNDDGNEIGKCFPREFMARPKENTLLRM